MATSPSIPPIPPVGYPPKRAPITPGCLYLVATPIGNLEDITLRAIRVLQEVDTIAAEDTRTARKLLSLLHIDKPLLSLFEANEAQRLPQLLGRLRQGEAIAVISEAGTPTLSDPGHLLNRACRKEAIPVDAIPGPAAVINALLLSGLSPARFRCLGFLPRKGSARRVLLEALAVERDTSILYESPRRLGKTLEEFAPLLGDR
ncbi:MAG: 16S rRNA (cytidine(1402)-2'-O)-methyltransferase, partial [Deltaproteobacteria bacterium]|nr:16S rRNA (cytidine(1402)-2'-O)-methyltransferase [Deltaproteobacteria bacterium]